MGATDFADLTPDGQVRRLRRLVPRALAHHDVEPVRIRLAARAFNTTFRVDARDGRRYALRVGAAWHLSTDRSAEVEARWTSALARDTALRPPQVIRARDGAAAVRVADSGVPGVRECVLFEWREGRSLRGRLGDLGLVATMGAVLATLHTHGTGFAGVRRDDVPSADRLCYFRLPDLLSARDGPLADAAGRAQAWLDRWWRARGDHAHLLHGDVHPNNVLVRHRRVVPIDFQDAVWGLEEQDLAITLVMLDRDDPGGAAAAALRRGYERHRAWPPVDDEAMRQLMFARRLHIANLELNVASGRTRPFLARLLRDLDGGTGPPR